MAEEKVNPWVELLMEADEMRFHQKSFSKSNEGDPDYKLLMGKSRLSEIKVDQLIRGLKKACEKKGIDLNKLHEQLSSE